MSGDIVKRLQSARRWLEKAEHSFDRHEEVSGELNLIMAQAEMQRLKKRGAVSLFSISTFSNGWRLPLRYVSLWGFPPFGMKFLLPRRFRRFICLSLCIRRGRLHRRLLPLRRSRERFRLPFRRLHRLCRKRYPPSGLLLIPGQRLRNRSLFIQQRHRRPGTRIAGMRRRRFL